MDDLTLGVEEEFLLVDAETFDLRPEAPAIASSAPEALAEDVEVELHLAQIETGTPVRQTLADVRSEMVRLRRQLARAAEEAGTRLAAMATHPFTHWAQPAQGVTPKPAYQRLERDYQQLTREQIVCGCHVHVGVPDRELAIRAMNRARVWLPVLVAISANSPFWLGRDTSYASFRTEITRRWPTGGAPERFASRAEYEQVVALLIETGSIDEPARIYWDLRPSARYDTLEFRASDVAMTVDEAVLVAAVARAAVGTAISDVQEDREEADLRPELLRAATWRAARYGLEETLIDVEAAGAAPAAEVLGSVVDRLRPALEAAGDAEETDELLAALLARGTGAVRQRAAYARRGRLEDVVDHVVGETAP